MLRSNTAVPWVPRFLRFDKSPPGPAWWRFVAIIAAFAVAFAALARPYIHRYVIPLRSSASIYLCFYILLVLVVAPGVRAGREAIERWISKHDIYALPALWCVPYLVYAAGTSDFRRSALARLIVVAVAVPLIYRFFPVQDVHRLAWEDVLVGIGLISTVLWHFLNGIWNVPVNLDFTARLFLIVVGGWSWLFVRPVPKLGYEFVISGKVLRAAGVNFLWFAILAIPAGLAMRFIAWNPRWRGAAVFCADYLEIFLFIALLEELFFRCFLQNLLSHTLRSSNWGQLVAAVLFGLFHILHAPFPNWRYVVLASIAGWFYGSAFRQGGNLMASSMMHAMVDTVWRTFLTLP